MVEFLNNKDILFSRKYREYYFLHFSWKYFIVIITMNNKIGVEDYSWPTSTGWQDIALINNLRAKFLEEFKNSLRNANMYL